MFNIHYVYVIYKEQWNKCVHFLAEIQNITNIAVALVFILPNCSFPPCQYFQFLNILIPSWKALKNLDLLRPTTSLFLSSVISMLDEVKEWVGVCLVNSDYAESFFFCVWRGSFIFWLNDRQYNMK